MLSVLGGHGPGEAECGMVHIKPGILRPQTSFPVPLVTSLSPSNSEGLETPECPRPEESTEGV